jgi:hypothetical protein
MKAVTGNRLSDGRPVYRTRAGTWSEGIEDAHLFDDQDAAEDALLAAREEETLVASSYLITVDAPGKPAAREAVRENIRAYGPTVRNDLGRQGSR